MGTPRNTTKPNSRAYRQANQAIRQALITLPAGGCEEEVPPIPESREWSTLERDRWEELWESPQATQWDETAKGTVALLVAYEHMLLSGNGSAWVAQECRYASEALGLTPKSLTALGWRIADGE